MDIESKLYLKYVSIETSISLKSVFKHEFSVFLKGFLGKICTYLIEKFEFDSNFYIDERNFDQYFLFRNVQDKKEFSLQNFREYNFSANDNQDIVFEIDEIFNRRKFFKTNSVKANKSDSLYYIDQQYMNEMWTVIDFDPRANSDPATNNFPFLLGSNKYPNSSSKMIRCEKVLYPDNFTEWWPNEISKIVCDDKPIEIDDNCLQNLFTVTKNKGSNLLNSTNVCLSHFDELKTFNSNDCKLKLLNTTKAYTTFNIEHIIPGNWDGSFANLKEPKFGITANKKNKINLLNELKLLEAYLVNDDSKFSKIINGNDDIMDLKAKNIVVNKLISNHLKKTVNCQKLTREQINEYIVELKSVVNKKIDKLDNDHRLLESIMTKRQLYVIVWDYYQINKEGKMKMFAKKMFNTGYASGSVEND
jgi:hypothetical protein